MGDNNPARDRADALAYFSGVLRAKDDYRDPEDVDLNEIQDAFNEALEEYDVDTDTLRV